MDDSGSNGFQKLVIYRLDQIENQLDELRTEVVGVRIDVAQLKVKAGIWGAAAGMIPAVITAALVFVQGGVGG